MNYKPKTGSNAGKRNKKRIIEYLKKNPEATGVNISNSLKLSLPTVYSHLKQLQKDY